MSPRKFDDLRPHAPTEERAPTEVQNALFRLRDNPDFRVFLNHYSDLTDKRTVDQSAPNTGALLLIEGRRNLLRDIKRDVEQARSERSRRKSGPE